MKKILTAACFITTLLLLGFSCKKSSNSNSTPDSNSTNTTPVNVTSSFSVNGTSEGANLTVLKGTTSNNNSYQFVLLGSPWTMQVIFSGSNTPVSGSYAIEDSTDINIPPGKCTIYAAGPNSSYGRPHTGTVKVTTGASNTIDFSNIAAPQIGLSNNLVATYTLSGVIKY